MVFADRTRLCARQAGLASALGLALASCSVPEGFTCESDAQCGDGVCLPGGCAFPNAECPSGLAYGELSPPPFAGECVEPQDGDDEIAGDGDDPGDGDGDGTGEGDGDGEPECSTIPFVPEYVRPNVMLVVDASGSMVSNEWDHDLAPETPAETRWATLYGVVETIMQEFGASMNSGVKRFPSDEACDPDPCYNASACTTTPDPEVEVGFDNGAAILAALPPADDDGASVEGGTPATSGIESAVAHLAAQPPEIPRYILLITDGAANCTAGAPFPDIIELYDETLEPTVQAARDDEDITTFVIGVDIVDALVGVGDDGSPEANPFERLNDIALAGGAPKDMGLGQEKFFNSTNQAELLMALGGIIDEITECVIDLSTTPSPPDPIQLAYLGFTADGEEVPGPVEDCANEAGWAWIEEGLIVTFCGSFCDAFKAGTATFAGSYGCPPTS